MSYDDFHDLPCGKVSGSGVLDSQTPVLYIYIFYDNDVRLQGISTPAGPEGYEDNRTWESAKEALFPI